MKLFPIVFIAFSYFNQVLNWEQFSVSLPLFGSAVHLRLIALL